mgnify:CR=1 FL=1
MGDEVQHLVVEQLKLLRGDVQDLRGDMQKVREESQQSREEAVLRFEAIEGALRDSAQQLVVLARGVHSLIQSRQSNDDDVDDLKRRVSAIAAG